MLAAGAAAIGWTTQGDEVAAGMTAVAFLICAVMLLAAGAANALGGQRAEAARSRTAGSPPSRWPCRICSSCRSEPRSASTRSGCCCTTRPAPGSSPRGSARRRARSTRMADGVNDPQLDRSRPDRVRPRPQRGRGARLCGRLGLGRRAAGVRAEQVRPVPRAAVDDRVRRACRSPGWSRCSVPILGWIVAIFIIPPVSAVLWLLLMYKAYQGERFKVRSPATWRSRGCDPFQSSSAAPDRHAQALKACVGVDDESG